MPKNKQGTLTTPDLVLLSLLAERPMHGYQANAELERREWRDWVDISRPQLYYSMEKLARTGMIAVADTHEPSGGPDRRVFATTAKGRAALASALEREDWSVQRDRPAFLTWLALSWQARPGVVARQLARRKEFLQAQLAKEQLTLRAVHREVGHRHHEAVWMIELMIAQFRTELRWLAKLSGDLRHRAPARRPSYAE
jgi:DNA-binding PadR family transcriptional regulator